MRVPSIDKREFASVSQLLLEKHFTDNDSFLIELAPGELERTFWIRWGKNGGAGFHSGGMNWTEKTGFRDIKGVNPEQCPLKTDELKRCIDLLKKLGPNSPRLSVRSSNTIQFEHDLWGPAKQYVYILFDRNGFSKAYSAADGAGGSPATPFYSTR